jgi:hypothetical protein
MEPVDHSGRMRHEMSLPAQPLESWVRIPLEVWKHALNLFCVFINLFLFIIIIINRLCSLVVRVLGYRSGGPGFDFRHYQIFWEVVGLERGPLSLVSTTEELPGSNSSCSCQESREYGRRNLSRWPRSTLYPQKKVALTSPASGARSVGIVRSRTQATEFLLVFIYLFL